VVAVALIIGSLMSDLKQIKLMPAGLLFYLIYCGLSVGGRFKMYHPGSLQSVPPTEIWS